MKNACRINKDGTVSILLNTKDGGSLEVIVDEIDYESYAEGFKGTWNAYKHPRTGKIYARGKYKDPVTGEIEQPMLHRLIANPYKGQITAHKDGNTLNCTRDNMINIPIGAYVADYLPVEIVHKEEQELIDLSKLDEVLAEDLADVLQRLKDNGLIEKGVSFHKTKRRWEVSAFHDGKRYRLGYFKPDELFLANYAVTKFRELGPDDYFSGPGKGGKS